MGSAVPRAVVLCAFFLLTMTTAAGRILKCELKAPDPADYTVGFTPAQWSRLNAIFAGGVCDWSKPGVKETDAKTWASFGPPPQNQLFDVTDPHGQP